MSVPQRQFSEEQIAFIRDKVHHGVKNKDLFSEFEQIFGEKLNECIFWKIKQRNGIENKAKTVAQFSEEEAAFVNDLVIQMIPQREIVQAFNDTFNKRIGQSQLRRMMKRAGIESSRKERVSVPIGYEYFSSYYQCQVVKVSESRKNGWRLKQNVVWEKETGRTLPRKWVVMFLDGNRMNYNPENLYAVPLQVAGTIARMNMASENATVNKTALMWGELFFALRRSN